jgi:2-dehydro-3-deoxy-D-arabinonate dehydratase
MKLYKLKKNIILEHEGKNFLLANDWDDLTNGEGLFKHLADLAMGSQVLTAEEASGLIASELSPPIGSQEVWAAGVTYLRSREARMEESAGSGAADLYDRVYADERPELFFKSLPHRVAGHNQQVYIRRDSAWNVPEPELTLFINSKGNIQGYTVGNDMSSRSIEGENALYLPQAKIYERSAALGPCLYVPEQPIPADTKIKMNICRDGSKVYEDETSISRMKRSLTELAGYLYRECDFPKGCFLMTGTCLVPPNDFTLQPGDTVNISISHIGMLTNTISYKPQ